MILDPITSSTNQPPINLHNRPNLLFDNLLHHPNKDLVFGSGPSLPSLALLRKKDIGGTDWFSGTRCLFFRARWLGFLLRCSFGFDFVVDFGWRSRIGLVIPLLNPKIGLRFGFIFDYIVCLIFIFNLLIFSLDDLSYVCFSAGEWTTWESWTWLMCIPGSR